MVEAAKVPLLILDDNKIRALMEDVRVLALAPCLAGVKQFNRVEVGRCGSCNAKRQKVQLDTMRQAKACISSVRGANLVALKVILNANKLRVFKPTNGGTIKVTF